MSATDVSLDVFERLKLMGIIPEGSQTYKVSGAPKIAIPKSIPGQPQTSLKRQTQQNVQNRHEGERNQRYYLEHASKSGTPWLHHPKHANQYSEFILVTPEMAEIALQYNNNPRKRIKQRSVEAYSRDMKSNNWIDTAESIDIDINGEIYNGQHRLSAIILAGVPVLLYVTFNTTVEARFGVDQGVTRSATEKLDLVIENNIGTKLAAVCRSMMRGTNQSGTKYSHAEIVQFAMKYGAVIEWIAKTCPGVRADVQAAFAKAALWFGVDRIEPFVRRFADVMFESPHDPARRLHDFVISSRGNGASKGSLTTYKRTVAAVTAYIEGKELRALNERSKDFFEWGPDWVVPAHD